MRLRTLPLATSCILVGSGFAFASGFFSWSIFWGMLSTMILMQILSNFANDLGDAQKGTDNDQRLGPERAIQSGVISKSEMKIAVVITAVLSFASGFWTLNQANNLSDLSWWIILGFGTASIAAAIGYTVGKKAFGYLGLGDAAVLLFFGPIAVISTGLLHGLEWSTPLLVASLATGLWSTGVLNLNNLRDIENDAASGKNTLAVKFGYKNGLVYHHILILMGLSVWLFLFNYESGAIGLILALVSIHFSSIKKKKCDPAKLNGLLPQLAIFTFLLSITYFVGTVYDIL